MSLQPEHGTLAARVTVPAGERTHGALRHLLELPLRRHLLASAAAPTRRSPTGRPRPGATTTPRNGPTRSPAPRDALARWDSLKAETLAFRDGLFGSTLPAEINDAASATLALLRTATVIRLEGGEIWAWEGQHTQDGSCEGTCTHVWNYQQALSHLFPALERTLRETEFTYNQLPTGGLTFRQKLPLGSGFDIIGPCADGHFGAIIKTYRDWKLSGDTDWLRRYWPNVKRAMEYAWSPENPDRWDPDETGILSGRQHQTLDMELFEPNSWLGSCTSPRSLPPPRWPPRSARPTSPTRPPAWPAPAPPTSTPSSSTAAGSSRRSTSPTRACSTPFDTGRKAGVLADGFMETYWSDEFGELKYQIGEGCISDQILGQWHAEVAGLGGFLDPDKVTAALKSVHANNFRANLADHFNPCRNYAYEDEGGLLVATYPEGVRQPMVAAPYAEEVWTGIEYMSASHMIMRGLVDEGLAIVRAARDRHDGAAATRGTTSSAAPTTPARCRPGSWSTPSPASAPTSSRAASASRPARRRLAAVLVGRHRLRNRLAPGRQLHPRRPRRHACSPPRSPWTASAADRLASGSLPAGTHLELKLEG